MRLKLTREQKVADRFLRGFDMVEDRLESSLIGLESAESARSSITSSIEAMGLNASQRDKMTESLVRMDAAVDDVRKMSESFSTQFIEIEDFISDVQRMDMNAGKVLRLVYINRLSVDQITAREEMSYSKPMIYSFLKRGLDKTFELLTERN